MMRRLILTTAVVSSLLLLGAASACAETLSPWWHLRSTTNPAYLQPSTAKEQVFQLTVNATAGEVSLNITPFPPYGTSPVPMSVRAGEAPEEVRSAFESTVYGLFPPPGPLAQDTARPGPNNGDETYEIKIVSEASIGLSVGESSLSGGPAKAEVRQISDERLGGEMVVTATNLGDGYANPAIQPVTVADKLPPGMEAVALEGSVDDNFTDSGTNQSSLECSLKEVSCTFTGKHPPNRQSPREAVEVPPYEQIEVRIWVRLTGAKTGAVNEASITGGGAPPASVRQAVTVSDAPVPFGSTEYEARPEEVGGGLDTQAGSHPFQFTTTYGINSETSRDHVAGNTKDLYFKLPPGFIGNPTPFPQCKLADFLEEACPLNTVVGVDRFGLGFFIPGFTEFDSFTGESVASARHLLTAVMVPLYNLEPAAGEPARFGFIFQGVPSLLNTSVRTGGDYGVTVTVRNITQEIEFLWNEITFWGTPGDARHNESRGSKCLFHEDFAGEQGQQTPYPTCPGFSEVKPPPLLTMPTSCAGPLHSTVEGDSWAEGLHLYEPLATTVAIPSMDGCNRLPFVPQIKVTPDGSEASKPTGLNVDVHVPQEGQLNGEGLAQSNIRNITVKLPAGVAINPSSGDGLAACSGGLVGFEAGRGANGFSEFPTDPGVSYPIFSSYLPGSIAALAAGDQEPLEPGKNFCANASKVGEVTIKTPLLPNPLKGFVYLAAQEANPFDSVLAMYLVAEDPVSGSLVKLPGELQLCRAAGEVIAGMTCETLGQLVSTFEDNPQLPFEDAELHFFGGERAPLATPSRCGTYTTEASYTPWSGGSPVSSKSSFEITSGPNHSRCVYAGEALPFSPSLTGGGLSVNAGWFSPFDATFSRSGGEQNMQSIEVHLPPGLSGILTGVELCPEPQANLGECGPNSLIGETTVGVGVGGEPFTVSGGKFYLTGPYNGTGACKMGEAGCAPFGITFVVPGKAGPFDFADTKNNHPACDCVLVRGKIEVNPITAAITITSDPPGTPDSIPTSLEGIPLEIQHVNAITTRNDFQFNPTNCSKMAVTGTIYSSEGASDAVSVPFQVTNCAVLRFKPGFKISTSGKTSRANGASLNVKLTYPKAPFGTQANIKSIKVDLPKQLPSRLTTLQKACPAKTFEANPAGCPAASIVGHASAITPLIPVPLTGPAYFVSYGGAKFPELVIVLQGYGVTLDVHGETFINKAGITSSTFHTIPDAPVGSFEMTLPQGPDSALAANGNLCESKLAMPTAFVAQNGAEIRESTPISVTGCAKTKTLTRAQKLAVALKACKKKTKGKRAACENAAQKKYDPVKKTKKK